ncbi:Asp-tRNA(Asn)/Glu-tRNA(Gln) amidotransferase subunit GatB [Chloroflexota bacterium]
MNYETIIGLEVHAQLHTQSKMFCRCSADYANTPPNTHVCPVCLGMPGVLPVINQQAIEYTMMTALVLNCGISEYTKFDRKNYPYPDLMKGYQISQYDAPIGHNGWLTFEVNGQEKKVGITRVHLEEDVAKLLHRTPPNGEGYSLVDVNRSGVPLMEVVGEPDLRSPEEARQYLIKLHSMLQYLDVSTANMEEGSFRCDANISIRPEGDSESMAKVEVKNMNSFKAVYRALEYEAKRQRKAAEEGKKLVQETRGWMEEKGETFSQRSKEYAHDYRYFPEPDLPPLVLNLDWVEEIKSKLPELPEAKRNRFVTEYSLSHYDADLLTSSKLMADYFEKCMELPPHNDLRFKHAKLIANWILGEFSRLLNATNTGVEFMGNKVSPQQLYSLIGLMESGVVSGLNAKEVFEEMFNSASTAQDIINKRGLSQISDTEEVEEVVSQVIQANTQALADYKSGKESALKFLVGQVMKATRGRANPQMVNELVKKKLGEE